MSEEVEASPAPSEMITAEVKEEQPVIGEDKEDDSPPAAMPPPLMPGMV